MNNETLIQCPHCHGQFPLTETLAMPVLAAERARLEQARQQLLAGIHSRELELEELAGAIASQQEQHEKLVASRVQAELGRLRQLEHQKAREHVGIELESLRQEVAENKTALDAARKVELDLRRQQRELAKEKETLALTVQRTIDAERQQIHAEEKRKADEEQRLKLAEKDQTIADIKKQLEAAQRASDKTSQQLQGDVQEADLATTLGFAFPRDEIMRTGKGQNGADILQNVIGPRGQVCGKILWESKRTKNWSDVWLSKLRDDQRAEGADIAVIVSAALPDDVQHCAERDGVWIVSPSFAPQLAAALRQQIVQVAQSRAAMTGQHEKSTLLYAYLTGPEFVQHIKGIVESFIQMQRDLESEKRFFAQRWNRREKQIKRMLDNTLGLYGDVQGISGASLPELEDVEPPQLPDEDGDGAGTQSAA
jgi:hypothetical protein